MQVIIDIIRPKTISLFLIKISDNFPPKWDPNIEPTEEINKTAPIILG